MFTIAELARATGAEILNRAELSGLGIATDSRKDCSNSCFIALKGETFDGHDSLADAVKQGATCLCIEQRAVRKIRKSWKMPVLVVPNTLVAYHDIARFNRLRNQELRVVGVTGSVGKTSVKEMIRQICIAACNGDESLVVATEGNTNNHFGVPANLLRITPQTKYAVIEMGTSSPGEIELLAATALPDVACVTSIAGCHLEELKSLDGVAEEKAAIFKFLPKDGAAVFPASCEQKNILDLAARPHYVFDFGTEDSAVMAKYTEGDLVESRFELLITGGGRFSLAWGLPGEHNMLNAACAAAAGVALGISNNAIISGLTKVSLPGMRMKVIKHKEVTWVLDAYNANPSSMRAALDLIRATTPLENVVLFLGDMLELGEASYEYHAELLLNIDLHLPNIAEVILVGEEMMEVYEFVNSEWKCFASSAKAKTKLKAAALPGRVILVKGSRGVKLEEALPAAVKKGAGYGR